jgi:C4-dicarboxylate-specific signal transduction histidine kinase
MDEEHSILLREKEQSFLGSVTAGISHELNNVLAIINEYAGLLEDLSRQDPAGEVRQRTDGSRGPLNSIHAIQKQVKRGESIVKRLNRFAHQVDEPVQTLDLKLLLEDTCDHAKRLVDRKRVRLARQLPEAPIMIRAHPLRVQHLAFACLQWILSGSPEGGAVTLGARHENGEIVIDIHGARERDSREKDEAVRALLDLLSLEVGGHVTIHEGADGLDVLIVMPPLN